MAGEILFTTRAKLNERSQTTIKINRVTNVNSNDALNTNTRTRVTKHGKMRIIL